MAMVMGMGMGKSFTGMGLIFFTVSFSIVKFFCIIGFLLLPVMPQSWHGR